MNRKLRLWESLFLLFVFSLPFQTPLQIGVATTTVQLSDIILAAACLIWVAQDAKSFRWTRFHALLSIFLAAMMLSAVFSADTSTSFVKLVGKASLGASAFLTFEFVRTRTRLEILANAWAVSSALIIAACLLGIAAFFSGFRDPAVNLVVHPIYGSLPAGNYPRIEGLFNYPSVLCNYLSVSLWMVVITTVDKRYRKPAAVIFAGLAIVAAFTLTPGLGGILMATGLFIGVHCVGSRYAKVAVTSSLLVASGFFAAASFTLFSPEAESWSMPMSRGEITPSHRALAWGSALKTFQEFPVFGKGIGLPTANAVFTDANGNRQLLADAHNTFINVLAETGLVGFVSFFALLGWAAWQLWRMDPTDQFTRLVRICFGLVLLDALFYQSLTGSYEDQRHLWVFIGAAAGFCAYAACQTKVAPDEAGAARSSVSVN